MLYLELYLKTAQYKVTNHGIIKYKRVVDDNPLYKSPHRRQQTVYATFQYPLFMSTLSYMPHRTLTKYAYMDL